MLRNGKSVFGKYIIEEVVVVLPLRDENFIEASTNLFRVPIGQTRDSRCYPVEGRRKVQSFIVERIVEIESEQLHALESAGEISHDPPSTLGWRAVVEILSKMPQHPHAVLDLGSEPAGPPETIKKRLEHYLKTI